MEERLSSDKSIQNIVMENRNKLTVSGVEEVDSFDENYISLYTILGDLMIEGQDLHINQLSVQTGEVIVEGEISSVKYSETNTSKQGSFISRLFK